MLYIVVAYLFSVAMRYIWVYKMGGHPEFYWNGELMINTNDGYFFASGAQHSLFGLHNDNPRIPGVWDYGVVFFTTLLAKITPFSLETIILYMPTFVSSLVVVPIILIARLYGKTTWGFFSALLGSIAWSYYNRTMTGYYDTDMFSAMAPMFILYFLIKSTLDNSLKSALYAAIMIIFYPFLYDQGLSIVYAMGIIYAVYMVLHHRKEPNTYKSLLVVFVALFNLKALGIAVPYNYLAKLLLVGGVYLLLLTKEIEKRKLIYASATAFVLFLLLGDVFGLIWHKIASYIIRGTEEGRLHFYAVNQTVREAGKIPFEVFANRISGSIAGLFVAAVGYVLLCWRYRAFILALPLVGIGVFALWGGLRFTVYAVPVAAMSAVFLIDFAISKITDKKKVYIVGMSVFTALLLYPNITHILGYMVPTVFTKNEVEVLDRFNQKANSKDYTITWWDYGYPIWFYSDTNTLIDGGKHNHDNFIVSEILTTSSQMEAANLSRIAVERYVSSGYKVVADTLFAKEDPKAFLKRLREDEIELPQKTREVYIYLPLRLLDILPTVAVFSDIDLLTGEKKRPALFYKTQHFKQVGQRILLGNSVELNLQNASLKIGKQRVPINTFFTTFYDAKGKLHVQAQTANFASNIFVVFMRSYNIFLVLDAKMYNSAFIQLFVFENYDKALFEPAVLSPMAKVYRVKR